MELPYDRRRASVVISSGGRFLWNLGYPGRYWRVIGGKKYVTYTDVGGAIERGESFEEAAIRECREETGCDVEILQPKKSFLIQEVDGSSVIGTLEDERALVVWRKRRPGGKILLTRSFLGRIVGTPRPSRETAALVYSPPSELFRRRTPTLGQFLSEGSEIIEKVGIPRTALMRPWGTPAHLRKLSGLGLIDISNILEDTNAERHSPVQGQ